MSTKIYNVFRVKRSEFTKFMKDFNKISNVLTKFALYESVKGVYEDLKRRHYDDIKAYRVHYMNERVSIFFDACQSAGMQIYIDAKFVYVRFYGTDKWIEKTKDYLDKYLENYHWQNQWDRPKNVTADQWYKREKTWERLLGSAGTFQKFTTVTLIPDFLADDLIGLPECLFWYDGTTDGAHKKSLARILEYLNNFYTKH